MMWPFKRKSEEEKRRDIEIKLVGLTARRDSLVRMINGLQTFPRSYADEVLTLDQRIGEIKTRLGS